MFQGSGHFGLTDVIREPPFVRHFNHAVPPPPGLEVDARSSLPEVSVGEKVAYMRDFGAWGLGKDEETRLLCRAVLAKAAGGSGAAGGSSGAAGATA